MGRYRHAGRVRIDFAVIERLSTEVLADSAFRKTAEWTLSRKSSLHRRKDGSYTLCLIWKAPDGMTLNHTMRGLRLERA